MINQDNITLGQRLAAPTPSFWKKFATITGTIAAVATAIVTLPVSLPAGLITVAGYVLAATTTITAVSATLPVDFKKLEQQQSDS